METYFCSNYDYSLLDSVRSLGYNFHLDCIRDDRLFGSLLFVLVWSFCVSKFVLDLFAVRFASCAVTWLVIVLSSDTFSLLNFRVITFSSNLPA